MALDFIGGVILIAAVVVNISVFANALGISQTARIGLVAVGGLWTGLQLSLYAAGAYQSPAVQTFPLVGPMVVLPPIIVGVAAIFSQRVRAILLAVPTAVADRPQRHARVRRVLPAAGGCRPAQRAVPLLRRLGRRHCRADGDPARHAGRPRLGQPGDHLRLERVRRARSRCRRHARHAVVGRFCDADLHRRPGSTAVQHMPWLLIPTVLVPFYLITHGIIFAQLRQRRALACGGGLIAAVAAREGGEPAFPLSHLTPSPARSRRRSPSTVRRSLVRRSRPGSSTLRNSTIRLSFTPNTASVARYGSSGSKTWVVIGL